MGTYNKGILGPFSGKVGTVVGANWRGKDVMRSLPKKTDRTPTETQLLQREKFTAVSNFLTPISNVVSLYYGSGSGELTRRNQAMSYHMKEAVTYVNPNFEILFDKVQISKGDLLGIQNPRASSPAAGDIRFNWEDNSGQGSAKNTDQLIVVLYSPLEDIYYTNGNAATRDAARVTLTLPTYFARLEVQAWITFASATGKSYATSVYLGAVAIG
ncbi:DUF6266 family protein [Flavobacterium sp.]|uniref:DUF6266 family protein n=1 Tax=Flavobacterium sp. TaxID=239 RepID=UPI00286B0E2F|nr:DUF6266 family protein [Flavobacterium sp.]